MGWQLPRSIMRMYGAFLYECCAVTHIGNRRGNQEDNFFMGELLTRQDQADMSQEGLKHMEKRLSLDNGRNRIFAVSDGMGGHRDGEVASCMAVEALCRFVSEDRRYACRRRRDKYAYIQAFQHMIRQTNREMLAASGKGGGDGMGATLSGVIAFADEIVPFNIGDSSTFLYECGRLRKLTAEDTETAGFGGSGGEAFPAGARRLTKYFGLPESGGILTAAISAPAPIRSGQMYLICSDGLTDSLTAREIEAVFIVCGGDAGRTADTLVQSALAAEGGGHDNITAVVVKIDKGGLRIAGKA